MKKILILMELSSGQKEKLEIAGAGSMLTFSSPDRVSEEEIQAANVIIGLPRAEMIKASENLELLQLESAGADAYIVPGVLNGKTVLTNATGAYSQAVAEHAFALNIVIQYNSHVVLGKICLGCKELFAKKKFLHCLSPFPTKD